MALIVHRRTLGAAPWRHTLLGAPSPPTWTPREGEDELHLGALGGLGLEWVSAANRFVSSIEATGGQPRGLGNSGDAHWLAALRTVLGLGIRLP